MTVLGEREAHLSALQRLALVDAAAWWLSEPNGGEEFAYALLAASCAAEVTAEHVYLALISRSDEPRRRRDSFLLTAGLHTPPCTELQPCRVKERAVT
jgi:hypothetical protein